MTTDATLSTPEAIRRALRSWREGATLDALVSALLELTTGPQAADPAYRVAAFDNDGTLACEKPYTSATAFLADAEGSSPKAADHKVLERLAVRYDGVTVDDYQRAAAEFLASARHPELDRSWREVVYQPMIELIDVLHALDFRVVMTTGSSRDFMRVLGPDAYHLGPEQVIGSEVAVEWRDGAVHRTDRPEPMDRGAGKPAHLWSRVGRLPLLAVGNTEEDIDMLASARVGIILDHDDDEREYAYRDKKALSVAADAGWIVVSMRDDFAEVFPPR